MYKLIIEDDEGKTTVVPLIRDEITIGRKEGNTIRLTERNVSRRHAKLVKSNGSVVIEDLQSHNGIKLNGDRVSGRAPVAEGDRIQIGDYQLALKLDKAQAAPQGMRDDEKTVPFDKEAAAQEAASDGKTELNPTVAPAPSGQEEPARLVVVSSNFAGQAFSLDKAAVVIGRTDENDVVINHRSISRHHAKIVREAGHYHVVDLQSANGVRVNGEEYGKVELRKGDHIDLGHVRLRFIAPNEDFVFERDAKIVDVGEKRGKGMLFAGIGIGVVVLGVGAFAIVKMMGSGSGGGDKPSGDVSTQVARLNVDVDKAMKSLDWERAIGLCQEGLKLEPSNELIRDKKVKSETEKKNEVKYGEYNKAKNDADFDRAVTAYQEIGEDSVYREKANETYRLVKNAYVNDHLARARTAANGKKCEEVRRHVEAVLIVDESNPDAQELAKSCGTQIVRPKQPKTDHTKVATEHPKTDNPKNPDVRVPDKKPDEVKPPVETPKPQGSDPEAEKLVQDSMDAYVNGRYVEAIDKGRKAISKGGNNPKAWRVIGAASCYLKNKDDAIKAWNRLGNMDRQFVKYICNRQDISIP